MDQLSEVQINQLKQINKLSRKFLLQSMLTGMHHGLILVAVNIFMFFSLEIIFPYHPPKALTLTCSVISAILVFRRMNRVVSERYDSIKKEIEKILEK